MRMHCTVTGNTPAELRAAAERVAAEFADGAQHVVDVSEARAVGMWGDVTPGATTPGNGYTADVTVVVGGIPVPAARP